MTKPHKVLTTLVVVIVAFLIGTIVSKSHALAQMADADKVEIEKIINAYFVIRYDAFKSNQPNFDFSRIVNTEDSQNTEWLQVEKDIREVQNFIHAIYDVKILDYSFDLNYQSIDINGNEAVVKLLESNEITYERRPMKPSALANIEHEIWLAKTDNGWLITRDQYSNDFTRLLNGSRKETIFENIWNNYGNASELVEQSSYSSPSINSDAEMRLLPYSNIAARDYADKYWDTRITLGPVPSRIVGMDGWQPSWDKKYKEYENDCTNFVSQAVFEGVSYTASDPNYFYPDYNYYDDWWYYKFSTTADGSLPWISVGDFRGFLTVNYYNFENFGIEYVIRGPAGQGVSLCDIHVGDLVFMYQSGWKHSVIVDDLDIYHCSANNVYVSAHSEDAHNRPLSDYSGYQLYPVEIKGYFNNSHVVFLSLLSKNSVSLTKQELGNPYPAPADNQFPEPFPQAYPGP